ncbi:MAG: hypothetical protein JW760_00145 [Spirochaetales bacterium]|nr:hypothetical protein [Spirochaetales bacterium]
MKGRPFLILLVFLFTRIPGIAQENPLDYESLSAELSAWEDKVLLQETLLQQDKEQLVSLLEKTGKTPFRDLNNKARILLFLAENQPSPSPEGGIPDLPDQEGDNSRKTRNKNALLTGALVTGGITLLAADVSFALADRAYERYIQASDPSVGGYYQQVWQSLDLSALIHSLLALSSFACATGCFITLEEPALLQDTAIFNPPGEMKFLSYDDQLAALDENIHKTADILERMETQRQKKTTTGTVFLATGLTSFLTSGLFNYLAMEADRRRDYDAYRSYDLTSNLFAGGGIGCVSLSLILRTGQKKQDLLERRLVELQSYRQLIQEEGDPTWR